MSFNDLPKELVLPICKLLANESPGALSALSMTTSGVYNIAAPLIYETLSIRFSGISELRSIVASINQTGLGRPFLEHVRRVEIMSYPERTLPVPSGRWVWRTKHYGFPDTSRSMQHYISYHSKHIEDLMRLRVLPGSQYWSGDIPSYHTWKFFRPLVSLLERLPCIEELSYAVANQFPEPLMETIIARHPSCRVSVWSFQSSDRLGKHILAAFWLSGSWSSGPSNMAVTNSQSLHAITIHYPVLYTSNKFGYPHWLIPLVAMAPNLKHVYLYTDLCFRVPDSMPMDATPIASKPKLKLQTLSFSATTRAQLSINLVSQMLGLPESGSAVQHAFGVWMNSIELSFLRELILAGTRYPSMLMEVAADLKCLERLVICVAPDGRAHTSAGELRRIFGRLNPLRYLAIQGLVDISLMHDILERHGPRLEGLLFEPYLSERTWLYPIIDDYQLQRLAEACPTLKDLRVPIRRSKGNMAEVLTYRALGRFYQLYHLIIDLHGDPRPVSPDGVHYVDDHAHPLTALRHGTPNNIRDILINFNIDRFLATAIWKEIASHQESHRLSMLRIVPWGIEPFDEDLVYVLIHLARSFLITNHGKEVVEIGERERREVLLAMGQAPAGARITTAMWQVLNSIWPWYELFPSFALQTDDA